jgi:hypothetical protein
LGKPQETFSLKVARYIFFSFSYEDVKNFKVNVVRNSWLLNNNEDTFIDGSIWETQKSKNPNVIKKLIDDGMHRTSVTAILIGENTANRRWVNYELVKSFERRNGILAININRIRGKNQYISAKGQNPLDRLAFSISDDGRKIHFFELIDGKWEIYSDVPVINNKKSNSLYFEDGLFFNDFGKTFLFSDKFETYCWIKDSGHKELSLWVEDAAEQVGR